MKISKIFHWLYFIVMMLPCVIIPIFAIYTRNENYNSNIEVITGGYETRQLFETSEPIINGNAELVNDYIYKFTDIIDESNLYNAINHYDFYISYAYWVDYNYNSIYEINGTDLYLTTEGGYITITNDGDTPYVPVFAEALYLVSNDWDYLEDAIEDYHVDIFESDYLPTETIYNEQHVYNDTDVGSQFVYTLYNATDKYFNFDNFFGLDNVYSWIQLNWFSGNAPLGFAIFWHFFTYWLLASLAWLLFDLMVYVPLYIHRWLDKGAIE